MQAGIQVGPTNKEAREIVAHFMTVVKGERVYPGFWGMFIDAWLKNKIAAHLRDTFVVKSLTVTGCTFTDTARRRTR